VIIHQEHAGIEKLAVIQIQLTDSYCKCSKKTQSLSVFHPVI